MPSFDRAKPSLHAVDEPSRPSRSIWTREHLLQAGLLASGILYSLVTLLMWWAARDSLALTRDQVLLGQRAYLIPQQVALAEPLAAGHPVKITFEIKNSGSTPATEVRNAAGVWLLPRSALLPAAIAPGSDSGSAVFLGAGETKRATPRYLDDDPDRTLRASELEAIRTGDLRLYAVVMLSYVDVFKHPGSTTACAVFEPAIGQLIECQEGNSLR
jgi:hypothetical protein